MNFRIVPICEQAAGQVEKERRHFRHLLQTETFYYLKVFSRNKFAQKMRRQIGGAGVKNGKP